MRRINICILFIVSFVFLIPLSQAAQTKGLKVVIKDQSGRKVGLYKGSYALVIGVSNYTAGWPKLESVPDEINRIEAALKKQGFYVVKILNPSSEQLENAFENFIDKYGFDKDTRLLFFFSGHGHTRKGGRKGYLVPIDAPDPRYDVKSFLRKAIRMGQILTWARDIEAKHALFLFDSCFSGTIFKAKALPKIPPHISDVTSRPVRQFISAGSAGEEVPANSVFIPSFIRAVRGKGDLDKDGYVTGTELGMYLHRKVLSYNTGQTPQYGKIKDPDLDEGDFVFALKGPSTSPPQYDSLQEERERLEQERHELDRMKMEIERKKLEAERKRLEGEKKKLEIASLPKKPKYSRPSQTSNVIERDGVYVAYANGIVKDTNTGFEWKVGPDKDMNWNEARSWVQSLNLDGGGWRMPTMDELEGLYKKGAGARNMTSLLKMSGWNVWSGETKGSSSAWSFTFAFGYRNSCTRDDSYSIRGFAVRSRSDG